MNLFGTINSGLFSQKFSNLHIRRGLVFGTIILTALLAFEIFNYSTTDYALSDVLGSLKFAGIRWSTILAIAFCGIDFAGIARLFTPDQGGEEANSVWYLFGAWLLAATMNAILTWWGVSMAIVNHPVESSSVVSAETLMKVVPVFVAVMVWLIRILIIGSLSYSSGRLMKVDERRASRPAQRPMDHPLTSAIPTHTLGGNTQMPSPMRSASTVSHHPATPNQTPSPIRATAPSRPAPKSAARPENTFTRPEPTYHSISMRGSAPISSNEAPRS